MSPSRFEFILPDLGEGVREAEIRAWHVVVGERVEEHQNALEVETDKAVVDVPVPRSGIIHSLNGQVGDRIAVGSVLLTIETGDTAGEAVLPPAVKAPVEGRATSASQGIVGVLPEAPPSSPASPRIPKRAAPMDEGTGVLALPRVRALARELGVSLDSLHGSARGGQISEAEVRAAAGTGPVMSQEVGGKRIPLTGLRRRIAEHLLESQQRTVFVTTMAEVDVTRLWGLKKRLEDELAGRDLKLTFLPFFMKAVQHGLVEFPRLNARVDEDSNEIELLADCHLGVAVDTSDGLMVPVVRDVAAKNVVDLALELHQLARQAENRTLSLEQLQGGSFTLTNFGGVGGSFATPVINYPNVGILGFGAIREKPWVVDGEIAVRRILPLSLTFDHRVLDGAEATRFLVQVGRYLEDPGLLFIESV